MNATRLALRDQGWMVLTLTVTHDPETTCYVPDLSHPMRELFRFPWERGEATPGARALRATGARSDRRMEAPFIGFELDCISPAALAGDRVVVITRRPEGERPDAMECLARNGHAGLPLECRPADLPDDALTVARYKAETATRWGCTHFVESDAESAIRIAGLAPHLVVSWRSAPEARDWLIGAAMQPGA